MTEKNTTTQEKLQVPSYKRALEKYEKTKRGKERKKRYFQTNKGKLARKKAYDKSINKNKYKKFGAYLKKKRLDNNISVKDLSDMTATSQTTIRRWEKGVAIPSQQAVGSEPSNFEKLAKALDIEVSELRLVAEKLS